MHIQDRQEILLCLERTLPNFAAGLIKRTFFLFESKRQKISQNLSGFLFALWFVETLSFSCRALGLCMEHFGNLCYSLPCILQGEINLSLHCSFNSIYPKNTHLF